MKFDPDVHHRRSLRLQGFDYRSAGAYFVTICTSERLCTLGAVVDQAVDLSREGAIIQEVWRSLPDRFAGGETDAFVVMPNHVHGVIVLAGAQFTASNQSCEAKRSPMLGEVVRTFKAASTRLIRASGSEGFAWQRGYYEHVVRNEIDLQRVRDYIEANPSFWEEDPENPAVPRTKPDKITGGFQA